MTQPYLKLPWPDDVYILTKELVSSDITGPELAPQCLWGHINNTFRHCHGASMGQISIMMDIMVGAIAHANNILVKRTDLPNDCGHTSKERTEGRANPLRYPYATYAYSALVYNVAWAALGYVTNQSDFVVAMGEKVRKQMEASGINAVASKHVQVWDVCVPNISKPRKPDSPSRRSSPPIKKKSPVPVRRNKPTMKKRKRTPF